MKVWIGCDHAGYTCKTEVIAWLQEQQIPVEDCGCDGERVDYPIIAQKVGEAVVKSPGDYGILICGTGVGMSIAANKIPGIRAALCAESFSARYTRLHNDANVLCMGARTLGTGMMIDIVDVFLHTDFEGGRHAKRVDMIREMEQNYK